MEYFGSIRRLAMELPRIDTHAHIGEQIGDLHGAGHAAAEEPVEDLGHPRSLAEGARLLYGVDPGSLLRRDADAAIWERAAILRGDGPRKALETAFDAEHIGLLGPTVAGRAIPAGHVPARSAAGLH